jgi:hypothetical protein
MRPWIWATVAVALSVACGESEPPPATFLLFGTIESTSVDASGAWVYLRLVPPGGAREDSALYLASCQLSGPTCEYQINQVVEGQYTVFGMIDLVPGALSSNPLPETGDLVSPGRPLTIFDRQQFDFPDQSWRLLP